MMRKNRSGWMTMAGRIAVGVCGLMWLDGMSSAACAISYSSGGYTSFTSLLGSPSDALGSLGAFLIVAGLVAIAGGIFFHITKNKENAEDEERSMITPEEGKRAEKAAADAVRNIHARQAREKAGKWTCTYCNTMVDGEISKCPACGAGRKK